MEQVHEGLSQHSYEALESMRLIAEEYGDDETLEAIIEEARGRDGLDDTDPRYGHMVEDCSNTISSIKDEQQMLEKLEEHI